MPEERGFLQDKHRRHTQSGGGHRAAVRRRQHAAIRIRKLALCGQLHTGGEAGRDPERRPLLPQPFNPDAAAPDDPVLNQNLQKVLLYHFVGYR